MIDVLIINHSIKNCGVYQFGRRIAYLALRSKELSVVYTEVDSPLEYNKAIYDMEPSIILHNWYPITMGWLTTELLRPTIKNFFIFHDGFIREDYDKYVFHGSYEKSDSIRVSNDRKILLPRPLFEYKQDRVSVHSPIPVIGSFGFGFWHKGFPELVEKVNGEMDHAIINLHIPNGHFGDSNGETARSVIQECYNRNKKPGIQLNITTDMKSNEQLLDFLGGNHLNAFLYNSFNEGLSSVIDYALSVKRPIAITDNMMFRHIVSKDITVENNSLLDILNKGIKPLENFYDKWSTDNYLKEFNRIFKEEL